MSTQISMGVRHTTFKQTPADYLIWDKINIITDQLPRTESVTDPLQGQFDADKFDVVVLRAGQEFGLNDLQRYPRDAQFLGGYVQVSLCFCH